MCQIEMVSERVYGVDASDRLIVVFTTASHISNLDSILLRVVVVSFW